MGLLRILPAVLALAGCFDPAVDGIYACRADTDCPDKLVCATDARCRHDRAVMADAGADLGHRADGATPLDLSGATDLRTPHDQDLSTPPQDLSTPPQDLSTPADLACKPRKCMPGDCGDLDNGCGGVLHCKKCDGK